jgi:hypothetical protein
MEENSTLLLSGFRPRTRPLRSLQIHLVVKSIESKYLQYEYRMYTFLYSSVQRKNSLVADKLI